MNDKIARMLIDAAENIGIESRFYQNYSGRGMYGEETTGIVISDLINLAIMAAKAGGTAAETGCGSLAELVEALHEARTDSLGRETIVY